MRSNALGVDECANGRARHEKAAAVPSLALDGHCAIAGFNRSAATVAGAGVNCAAVADESKGRETSDHDAPPISNGLLIRCVGA
jgi:hypothetical protein